MSTNLARDRRQFFDRAIRLLLLGGVLLTFASTTTPGLAFLHRSWEAATMSSAAEGAVLFVDYFNGGGVDPSTWVTVDTRSKLRQAGGFLDFHGFNAPPSWGDPAVYSVPRFSRQAGLTAASIVRPAVHNIQGPYPLLSPTCFPTDPAAVA